MKIKSCESYVASVPGVRSQLGLSTVTWIVWDGLTCMELFCTRSR